MKHTVLTAILCTAALVATAQKLEYRGYSGSMFMHAGKIKSGTFEVTNSRNATSTHQIDNMAFGLGGKLAFQFGKGLRFGMEGYNSRASYGDYKSTYSVGWGGLTADYFFTDRIMSYYGGATLGGGQVTNTVVTEPQILNYRTSDILRRRYGVGLFTPFFGTDINVNEKLKIALKIDYTLRFFNTKHEDWATGARVYLGATFRP